MIKYSTPEMEMLVVETADIVLTSPVEEVKPCEHDYYMGVCTKCGAVAETGDDEF